MTTSSSYYDIDAILAEEELIPCETLGDFSHLAYLDPDYNHHREQQKLKIYNKNNNNTMTSSSSSYLPERSRIKLPLWAVEKLASLAFVQLSIPRHYNRKARERLEADPGDANLRKRNERYFSTGKRIVELIEYTSKKVAKSIASKSSSHRNSRRTIRQGQALERLLNDAIELRKTLVKTYAGERLRKTFDWSLSTTTRGSIGDDDNDADISFYTDTLTNMEQRLFQSGTIAISAVQHWKQYGNRRLGVANTTNRSHIPSSTTTTPQRNVSSSSNPNQNDNTTNSNNRRRRAVTPGDDDHNNGYEQRNSQRRRLD